MYTLTEYKHDVERFVADLAKLAVIKDHEKNNLGLMASRLQAINGLGLCLSAKTNFLNYLELKNVKDEDVHLEMRRHSLVRSIERISYTAKQLNVLHHGRNVKKPVDIDRHSYSEFIGPDFFEFIPFSILDNAVKYNLRDGRIKINIFEAGKIGYAEFTSVGPAIEDCERESIFSLGYRGVAAKLSSVKGNGIGFYHAREAIRSAFGGDLILMPAEGATFSIGGVEYASHTFRIELPLAT